MHHFHCGEILKNAITKEEALWIINHEGQPISVLDGFSTADRGLAKAIKEAVDFYFSQNLIKANIDRRKAIDPIPLQTYLKQKEKFLKDFGNCDRISVLLEFFITKADKERGDQNEN